MNVKLIKGNHFEPLRVDLPTMEEVRQYLADHSRAHLMPPPHERGGEKDSEDEEAEGPVAMWIVPTVTLPTSLCQYFEKPMTPRRYYQTVHPDLETAGLAGTAEGLELFFRALAQANPRDPETPALNSVRPQRVTPCDIHTPDESVSLRG